MSIKNRKINKSTLDNIEIQIYNNRTINKGGDKNER